MYGRFKDNSVVKQLKLQKKISKDKDSITPEELQHYYSVMDTISCICEAVKWDNNKHKVRV